MKKATKNASKNILETERTVSGAVLEVKVIGIVNSATTPQFAETLEDLEGINQVIIDCTDMNYISSTGLRTLLQVEKAMRDKGGELIIANVRDEAMEVFELTGLDALLAFR